jgi:hypothetical protein
LLLKGVDGIAVFDLGKNEIEIVVGYGAASAEKVEIRANRRWERSGLPELRARYLRHDHLWCEIGSPQEDCLN